MTIVIVPKGPNVAPLFALIVFVFNCNDFGWFLVYVKIFREGESEERMDGKDF